MSTDKIFPQVELFDSLSSSYTLVQDGGKGDIHVNLNEVRRSKSATIPSLSGLSYDLTILIKDVSAQEMPLLPFKGRPIVRQIAKENWPYMAEPEDGDSAKL